MKSQPERQLYNSFSYRLNQGRLYSFEINVESAEGSFSPAEKSLVSEFQFELKRALL